MTRRLNILFLTTSYPLRDEAASGIFVKRLVDALQKKVNVTVITPNDTDPSPPPPNVKTFNYAPISQQLLAHSHGGIPVALRHRKLNYLYSISLVARFFFTTLQWTRQADVLHANWSVTGVVAGLAGILTHKPAITTLRGEDVHRTKSSFIFKFILYICLILNRYIVCVSTDMQNELQLLFPAHRKKIVHIANGVAPSFHFNRTPSKPGSKSMINILCVGSLIPRKDFATTIKAIANSRHREEIILSIVGEGPERSLLEELTSHLGLTRNVNFVGRVPPDQIALRYSDADIFIISSLSEGRPNVLLEAMASELAILATRIPGILELIDDNVSGLLFNPGDTTTLANLVDKLIEAPEIREKLARHARKQIYSSGLDWGNAAEQYLQVYQSLTSARS